MTGGVLFDFDGTLVDTFDGIVEGIQEMRAALGAQRLPPAEVRRHIGWGIQNLVAQSHPWMDTQRPDGLPPDGEASTLNADEVERCVALFRDRYGRLLMSHSQPYPEIPDLCRRLAGDGISLAVVSNKPARFVRQLLTGLGLTDPFRVVIGGDSLAARKPDAAPLLHAAGELDLAPGRCVMVGDSPIDLAAARAAQMPCCAVTWGLLPESQLVPHGPAQIARSVGELETWIRNTLRILAFTAATSA
jgi:phosphoglycolate phosphatase